MKDSKLTIQKILIYCYLYGLNLTMRLKYAQIVNDITKEIMLKYKKEDFATYELDIYDIIKNYLGPCDIIANPMYNIIIDNLINKKFIKKEDF